MLRLHHAVTRCASQRRSSCGLERRGEQRELRYLEDGRVLLKFYLPWAEVVVDLHDHVKSITSGYASFNYIEAEHRTAKVGSSV